MPMMCPYRDYVDAEPALKSAKYCVHPPVRQVDQCLWLGSRHR
jgi:hypothetical protein